MCRSQAKAQALYMRISLADRGEKLRIDLPRPGGSGKATVERGQNRSTGKR